MKTRVVTLTVIILAATLLLAFVILMAISPLLAKKQDSNGGKHIVYIDYSKPEGEMCYGASGWLYGMSEDGIPSGELLSPLSPAVAVAKAPDGEQHPVGDVQSVGGYYLAAGGDYLMIYLQDIFPDWYYVYEGYEDFAGKVEIMVDKALALPYGDKVSCCPFNECDNGQWYGKFSKQSSRFAFYNAWCDIYNLIKAKAPDMKIAGPGYMEYKHDYIYEFMKFCAENDCLPDIIIWHELSNRSYYEYRENYADYRELEQTLGIDEIEICISEYGQPSDNGVPGKMVQYIADFESTKVNACLAFWRLADNLSELAADNNTPAAAWWLYYRYGQMRGNSYSAVNPDPKGSHLRAITSYDPDNGEITIIAGGENGDTYIELNELGALGIDYPLYATIEFVDYEGLGGECLAPTRYAAYPLSVYDNRATISLPDTRADRAYFITLSGESCEDFIADEFATRYEAEDGKLVGLTNVERSRATPKPNYAVSGKFALLPEGADKYLEISIEVPKDDNYLFKICYANGYKEDSRALAVGNLRVDDNTPVPIVYPNTLSYTTTGNIHVSLTLTAGKHILKFGCVKGQISFDFIDVVPSATESFRAFALTDGQSMFVVPEGGYYKIIADETADITFRGQTLSAGATVYLMRGVNFIDVKGKAYRVIPVKTETLPLNVSESGDFSDPLSVRGKDNYILINVDAPHDGTYALRLNYANDSEFGVHDYNVKLVERYATISVGAYSQRIFFRNTYGVDNFSERVIYLPLREGMNSIKIYNDNSYHPDTACCYLPLFQLSETGVYPLSKSA